MLIDPKIIGSTLLKIILFPDFYGWKLSNLKEVLIEIKLHLTVKERKCNPCLHTNRKPWEGSIKAGKPAHFPQWVQIPVSFLEIFIFISCTHGTALLSNRINHSWIYLSMTYGLSDPKETLLLYARQCARHLRIYHLIWPPSLGEVGGRWNIYRSYRIEAK